MRIKSLFLFVVFLNFLYRSHSYDIEGRALEKTDAAQGTLDFLKRYCVVNFDYDQLVICKCKAFIGCVKKDYLKCLNEMTMVLDVIIGYMFEYCTGYPPIADIMQGITTTLPDRPKNPELDRCRCRL